MTTSPQPSPPSPPSESPSDILHRTQASSSARYPKIPRSPIQDTTALSEAGMPLTSEQESEQSRIDTMAERMLAIGKSQCEMKALLRTIRDTNANLDKTMERFNGSLGRLELKYKILARRKADEVGVAKSKAKR